MDALFVSKTNLSRLIEDLDEHYSVLVPVAKGGRRQFACLSHLVRPRPGSTDGTALPADISLGGARTVEPLKAFCFRARERVSEDFDDRLPATKGKPFCVVGAKACDLAGFKILDSVFLDSGYTDPIYAEARRDGLIIATDCTSALDVCFCLALSGNPFPTEGFDLALSEIEDGYVAEPGSRRGEDLLQQAAGYFRSATSDEIARRDSIRREMTAQVNENLRTYGIPTDELLSGVVRSNYDDPLWEEEAQKCVECGACNVICPTCHCFQLLDRIADERLVRYRLWDSCLIKDFARVAGGANPRPELWMRLRNRFEKKFDFFPNLIGRYACTGCGRCILACPAKIDIRHILRRNVENVSKR